MSLRTVTSEESPISWRAGPPPLPRRSISGTRPPHDTCAAPLGPWRPGPGPPGSRGHDVGTDPAAPSRSATDPADACRHILRNGKQDRRGLVLLREGTRPLVTAPHLRPAHTRQWDTQDRVDGGPHDPLPIARPGQREPDPWLRGGRGVTVVSGWLFFTPHMPATEQGTWGLVGLDDSAEAGCPLPRSRRVLAWVAAVLAPRRPLLQRPLLVWARERGFSPKIGGRGVKGTEMTREINEHTTSMSDWQHGDLG